MTAGNTTLRKSIRPFELFTLGFGTIIGVGWMIVAGQWVLTAGPVGASIAFIIGGLVIMVIALSYVELGMMFPQSGAEVVYVYEGFGSLASFSVGWFLTLTYIAITAFEAISTAWIIDVLFPGHAGPVIYRLAGEDVHLSSVLIGLAGMAWLCWINYRGGGSAAKLQDVFTIALAVLAAAFFVAGIAGGDSENIHPLVRRSESGSALAGILAVLVTVPVWYSGFNTVPQALGEVIDLRRSSVLLVGLGVALLLSGLFYIGVIFTVAFAAPAESLRTAEFPVAAAVYASFESRWPGHVVLIAGLLGIITSWNAMFFAAARVLFALSRARIVPAVFSRVHERFGSPSTAVLFVGVVGGLGTLAGRGALMPIINTIGICLSLAYMTVCVTVIRLRRLQPGAVRPYRVPGGVSGPWVGALLAAAVFVLALIEPWRANQSSMPIEWTVLIVWAAIGIVCWYLAAPIRSSVTESERALLIHQR